MRARALWLGVLVFGGICGYLGTKAWHETFMRF
jgi:hypothetical protein